MSVLLPTDLVNFGSCLISINLQKQSEQSVWRLQLWTSVHFTLSKTFRTWEILRLNLTRYIIVIGLTSTKLCHWSRMYFDKPKKVSYIKQTHQAPIFCIHCNLTIHSNTISFCKLKMFLLVSKSDWYYNHTQWYKTQHQVDTDLDKESWEGQSSSSDSQLYNKQCAAVSHYYMIGQEAQRPHYSPDQQFIGTNEMEQSYH